MKVDKNNLDAVLERHAQFQSEIATELSEVTRELAQAKEELALEESRLYLLIKDTGDRVAHETALARVKTNRSRIVLAEAYNSLKQECDKWSGLYEAWKSRGFNIKTLSDLYSSQYFAITSAQSLESSNYRPMSPSRRRLTT
jgi:hypothetical protein